MELSLLMYGGFGWIYGYPKASECHIYRPLNHRVWEERERTERERTEEVFFFFISLKIKIPMREGDPTNG